VPPEGLLFQLFSAGIQVFGAQKLKNRNWLPITRENEGALPSVNCFASGEKGSPIRHHRKRFLPATPGSRSDESAACSLLNNT